MCATQKLQAYVALSYVAKSNEPLESTYLKFCVNTTDKRGNKFCYVFAYVGTIIKMVALRGSEI
jgi:hypothetical protein